LGRSSSRKRKKAVIKRELLVKGSDAILEKEDAFRVESGLGVSNRKVSCSARGDLPIKTHRWLRENKGD